MQRLRSAHYGCQCLDCHSRNVVHRLLCWQGYSGGLGMKSHEPCALILGAESILHHPVPNFSRRSILRNFLEEIIVRIKKETQSRPKVVYIKTTPLGPF